MTIITDPLKAPRLDITSARGVPFMILVDVAADLVEFWDLRHPMPHFNAEVRGRLAADMPGQFVTRYDIETIARPDRDTESPWSALILDGDEPDWRIDGAAMSLVRRWLRFTVNRAKSITV